MEVEAGDGSGCLVAEFGLDAGQLERLGVAEEGEQTGVLSFLFP